MHPVVAPSAEDPFVAGASEVVGGPLGRHARPVRQRVVLTVVLALTVLTCLAGWAQKSPCRSPYRWTNEFQYTRMCYTDVFALYYSEGLDHHQIPYADHPVEYPVVIGGSMALVSWAVQVFPASSQPARFFDLTALLLAAAAVVVAWTTVRLAGRRRPWDAAMVALAPVLLLHAYTNWDLLAVAASGVGLYAWSRRRPVWAGVALGVGVATKLYPLLLLGGLLLLCVRAGRKRAWLSAAAAAAVTWLVVDVPIWLAYPRAFGRFYAGNSRRGADWDSLWYGLQHLRNHAMKVSVLNIGVAVAFLSAVGVVAFIVFVAPRRPRVASVCFLLLTAFLLTNKVFSPQYVLWLLPVAVLARPRWPMFLLWQASEVFLLFTRFYYFVGIDRPGQGVPVVLFLVAVVVRDLVLLAMAALVVREAWRPDLDVVRRDRVDDPAGGVLDGAPDTLGWTSLPVIAPAQPVG